MSEEVLRFYQRGARGGRGLRLGRRRRPVLRYVLLALVVSVPLGAWWLTRDTWDMGRLIPKDHDYALLFPDLIEGRKVIARSPLWQALPADLAGAHDFQEMLRSDFGLPEWLINNVAVGAVHVSGKDMEQFGDALIVTRMTRLGALLQRFSGWSDMVSKDHAGGLELRRVKDTELWLAVRGRVMLASRDRDALIRALVLTEEEALGQETLETTLESAAGEMLQARVKAEALPWAAPHATAAGVQMWLSDDAARAVVTCRLSDAAKEAWAPVLSKATAAPLPAALPGALRISADLGVPAVEAWQALAQTWGGSFDLAGMIEPLIAEPARPIAGEALRAVLADLGRQWSISYRGINQLAFAPMPRFAGLFSMNPAALREMMSGFPPLPEGVPAWETVPRLSSDGKYVEMPLIGGPDLHMVLAPYAGRLLMATSLRDAQELLASSAPAQESSATGNVLVEADTAALVQDALDTGLQLADLRMIRGHTPESLAQWFVPWQQAASRVPQAGVTVGYAEGTLTLDLKVGLRGE